MTAHCIACGIDIELPLIDIINEEIEYRKLMRDEPSAWDAIICSTCRVKLAKYSN